MNTEKTSAQGILLMVAAMACFAIADTFVKLASAVISPPQVMFLLMGGSLVLFVALALAKGERLNDRRAFAPIMMVRYVAEVVAIFGMVLALKYVPISIVGAITQATPLLVALGAVLLLGEKVSWRRWSAIAVGFVGVLLIVQPGAKGFDVSVFWAVLSMIGLSVRDLTTRMTPPGMASSSLAAYSMFAALPFSVGWVWLAGQNFIPENANWLLVVAMVTIGSLGYVLLIASIRVAEISVVTPYRYSRLLFLLAIGILVFDERPGFSVFAGAALVVLSGLYTMWRERSVGNSTTARA